MNKSQDELLKDPAFKRYATVVDRALTAFETIVEWPDYIAFLARLQKALQAYPTCRSIPSKLVVSSRLAQCLNPSLPSGVHQKALEQTGLAEDLKVWLPGLLPLFKYASLAQKSHFLTLFETFIIPLGPSFRPAEKAVILALLPGMEEEHGEYFENTLSVIDQIRLAVKDEEGFFWQCLWLAIATSTEQRMSACNYCLKRMESLKSEKAEWLYTYPDRGLFIHAFCAGLTDSNALVQRGFLELLLQNVPLDLPILQKHSPEDLERLILSAITVVLRRDVSLNRRLYVWLLGPDSKSSFFVKYALQPLTSALKKLLVAQDDLSPDPIRVSKISLALLDKWEIGGHVVPGVFTSLMEAVYSNPESSVLSSARALFDNMDPAVIWAELFSWIEVGRVAKLIWVVDTFNLREEEMLVRHIPQVLLHILCLLRHDQIQGTEWFKLTRKLVQLLPVRAFTTSRGIDLGPDLADVEVNTFVGEYYRKINANLGIDAPLPESISGIYFHKHLLKLLRLVGEPHGRIQEDYTMEWIALLKDSASIVPPLPEFDLAPAIRNIQRPLKEPCDPQLLGASIETTIALLQYQHIDKETFQSPTTQGPPSEMQDGPLTSIAATFLHQLWRNLAPDRITHHVESVTYIWSFTTLVSSRLIETLLANEVDQSSASEEDKAQACSRFAVLWKHSVDKSGTAAVLTKAMMLILRFLKAEETSPGRISVERWLAGLGNGAHRMFDIIFTKLLEDRLLRAPVQREYKDIVVLITPCSVESDDVATLSYHLDLLLDIFRLGNENLRSVCSDDKAVLDPSRLELLEKNGLTSTDMTYSVLLVRICLRALFVEFSPDSKHTQSITDLAHLHLVALRVLHEVMSFTPSILASDIPIGLTLLKKLYMTIDDYTQSQHLQKSLMDLLLIIFERDGGMKSLAPPSIGTNQGLSRQRSITGKKSHIKGNVEDALGPISLLLHTVLDALAYPGPRPLLDTWSRFFLRCLPYFSDSVFPILIPTVDCVGKEVERALAKLQDVFITGSGDGENALEQCVTLLALLEGVLFRAHGNLKAEELKLGGSKGANESAKFLNNVMSGVWGGESLQSRSGVANNRLTILLCAHDVVRLCYNMWSWDERLARSEKQVNGNQSKEYTSVILKDTSRRIMQNVHAVERLECFETLIDIWNATEMQQSSQSVFGLLKILNGYKDNQVFVLFVDAINSRINPSSMEPARRSSLSTNLYKFLRGLSHDRTIATLLDGLIAFVQEIELSSVEELNPDCLAFLKDCVSNPATFKNLYGGTLTLATVYGEKLEDSVIADKKKMRKDFGELYIRVLTLSLNQGSHPRASSMDGKRITLYQSDAVESAESLSKPGTPDLMSREFLSPPHPERSGSGRRDSASEMSRQLTDFVIPKLNAILDLEKSLAACTLIMNQIISPALRKRNLYLPYINAINNSHSAKDTVSLNMLLELVQVSGSHKSWRREVYDSFNDNAFFSITAEEGSKWKLIFKTFLANDKERVVEFISRISAATSSILRSSRDQDRLINVRRLSFLIISGEVDQFVPNINSIKEKLTELGRTASIDPIHGEILLLFRALMLRLSPVHMVSFWPIIISEIQTLLYQILEQAGIVSKEQLPLFFETCKVLDMMLVVQSEDFQLQEWIFITDTIEAVYRSPNSHASALVDRLAIRMGSGLNVSGSRGNSFSDDDIYQKTTPASQGSRPDFRPLRRPIIRARTCQKISDLVPFMSHLSVVMYENSYALSGPVDMEACEQQVLEDIFREG